MYDISVKSNKVNNHYFIHYCIEYSGVTKICSTREVLSYTLITTD